ncbi:Histidine kinase [Candidatus Methylomirabilis lanthanidiphila]|uniref:histidine kinase n=1 Tax=Candidatus Methylomirabilis lanthanidiphila TaxID=2211376 RepID=A0A564ZKR3_9BACT|nr:GAF domain-containing protein [Candidatus Methylomirabilis lanthanidiphila]VUZ85919.1 Histidine kinase [Candidatus Methylomirabilis lanthanidiphila]
MNIASSCTPFHAPDTPAVLLDIAQAVSSTLDLRELLKIIAQRTAAACGADVCSIFLCDAPGERMVPMMAQVASGERIDELWEAFTQMGTRKEEEIPAIMATIEQQKPVILDDPATGNLLPIRWIKTFRLKALLSVPLIRHNHVIGVLVLHQMVDGKRFIDAQVALASAIASQVALAIENAKLFQTTQERLRECETLLAVSQSASSTLDLKEALLRVAKEAALAAEADSSGAYLLDSEQGVIRPFAGYNLPEWVQEPFQHTPLALRELPIVHEAFDRRVPVYSSDVPTDPRCEHPAIRTLAFRSCLFAPMIAKEKLIGGLFLVWWEKSHACTPEQLRLMDGVARQAAMAIDHASAYHEIEALNIGLEDKIAQRTRELSEMNQALEASHRRLRELDRAKSDFLLNVSHELRTPLTAIKGSVDNMLDQITGPLSEPQQRYLLRVQANTDQLVRLINDLLDLARIEEGRVQLTPALFSVSGLVGEVLDALRPIATEKGLRLQLIGLEDPLIAYADGDKVTQILMNLIGNAIKFTPNGGQITVTARQVKSADERVEIAVTDTGEGIPTEDLPHIFDKFYQVQLGRQAKAKGTGLGLSIAKSLVELQGGCIWAKSQVGRGSAFVFTLPRRPSATSHKPVTLDNAEQTA